MHRNVLKCLGVSRVISPLSPTLPDNFYLAFLNYKRSSTIEKLVANFINMQEVAVGNNFIICSSKTKEPAISAVNK